MTGIYVGANKPTITSLSKYRVKIALHWRELGIRLLQEKDINKLNIIKENHPSNIERCCDEMIKHWLDVDTEASWDKLIRALKQIEQNALAAEIKQDVVKGILQYS